MMIIFFIVFFAVYTLVNYYVFIRGWQSLSYLPVLKPFYIFVFLLFSLSYIIVEVLSENIPSVIYDALLWTGSFWFAFLLYFVLFLSVIDLVRITNHFISFLPVSLSKPGKLTKLYFGAGVTALVILIVSAGFINRSDLKVKELELTLPGQNSAITELNVVMFSDVHLSPINNNRFLSKIADEVNELNPDIILLPGDIVDDKPEILNRIGIGEAFKKMNSRYGIFASTGNHEFINGADNSVKFMEDYGINVLRDSLVKINDSFYVVGREDRSSGRSGKKRKSLSAIIAGKTGNLPAILMDHTPVELKEAMENDIDLQLSGHTHNGQMFPLNLITGMIYEVSWGYLKKGKTHYYVSSGAGTWGPPVKLASDAEIVNIKIAFK